MTMSYLKSSQESSILWGEKVFVNWKLAPLHCTFCNQSGHKKNGCEEFKQAKKDTDQLKTLTQARKSSNSPPPQPTIEIPTPEEIKENSIPNGNRNSPSIVNQTVPPLKKSKWRMLLPLPQKSWKG